MVSVPRQTVLAGSSPFHNPLDNGGRLYGGCASAEMMPMVPLGSDSRIARAAASAVMPPPTIR